MVALAACAAGALGVPLAQGQSTASQDVVLRVGDRMQVEGQPIGCQVVRKHGQVLVDCRRAGDLKGTYGTYLGARRAMVAHYHSSSTAKVVFVARHHHRPCICDDTAARKAR